MAAIFAIHSWVLDCCQATAPGWRRCSAPSTSPASNARECCSSRLVRNRCRDRSWPNGAVASIYNATEPEQLRGPEHGAAGATNCASGSTKARLGKCSPSACVPARIRRPATTPPPTRLLKAIMADPRDNKSNLAPAFLEVLQRKYAGTRLDR